MGNTVVAWLLHSPLHGLLSGSTNLVRYTGRRSGHEYITPTQYARSGDDVVILVGNPDAKTWWRNFANEGDIDVMLQRRWVPMTARAVVGSEDPATIEPLLNVYLKQFPRAGRALGDGTLGSRARDAVMVWCRPR